MINKQIDIFYRNATENFNNGSQVPESRHIDDLLENYNLNQEDTIKYSIHAYQRLIQTYLPIANNYMAILVFAVTDSKSYKDNVNLKDVLTLQVPLVEPPSLYITRRHYLEPYIVEEYKLPIKNKVVQANTGTVYGYFRSSRNSDDELYARGFYFEHYPVE